MSERPSLRTRAVVSDVCYAGVAELARNDLGRLGIDARTPSSTSAAR